MTGAKFEKYEIFYGKGSAPTIWTQIGVASYTQIINGILESWQTTLVLDGQYTIKLVHCQ